MSDGSQSFTLDEEGHPLRVEQILWTPAGERQRGNRGLGFDPRGRTGDVVPDQNAAGSHCLVRGAQVGAGGRQIMPAVHKAKSSGARR